MTNEELTRKVARVSGKEKRMEEDHRGNENKLTYHAGFDLGYLRGMLAVLEELEINEKDKR